jgi:hypothetical protein
MLITEQRRKDTIKRRKAEQTGKDETTNNEKQKQGDTL